MTGKLRNGKTRQRGDTLVEVLIAILIVSMVLTGAFVTVNRAKLGIRDAQEHAEALKLAQGQLEQIKQNASQTGPTVFAQAIGADFCMVNAAVATGTACTRAADDQPAASGDQPAYRLIVERTACTPQLNDPQCNKFTIRVNWDSITTDGPAFEQIITRLYP